MDDKRSLAEKVAALPLEEREAVLAGLDPDTLQYDASFWLRPNQQITDKYSMYLYLGARGSGKTRTLSEFVRRKAREMPGCRIALVGRTAKDVRDIIVDGDSGVLNVCAPSERPEYIQNIGLLRFPNGSRANLYSAEVPGSLRGPQFHAAACDELASWKHVPDDSGLTSWDNLQIATRLGNRPQICVATTPKRSIVMKELYEKAQKDPSTKIVRTTIYDNISNLPESYIKDIMDRYEGTSVAKQELLGEMLDAEYALWSPEMIESSRVRALPLPLPNRVIAVDPTNAENPTDYCGIVVVAATPEKDPLQRHAYIIQDASIKAAPSEWVKVVVRLAKKFNAPVVVEGSGAQQLLVNLINAEDPSITVYLLQTGNKSKATRAEPVVLLYEKDRVHHLNYFSELEEQMIDYDPSYTKKSPDRIDALVHGVTALLISPPPNFRMPGQTALAPRTKSINTPLRVRPSRFPGRKSNNR